MVDNTFEKIKSGAKEAAKKVPDSETYLDSTKDENEDRKFSGGNKETMNPEDIAARAYFRQEG
jgi:hypothetical protein